MKTVRLVSREFENRNSWNWRSNHRIQREIYVSGEIKI